MILMKKMSMALTLSAGILVTTAALPAVTPLGISSAEASVIKKTQLQTTAKLLLRESASTKAKKLATIPKETIITATEKKSGWYKVTYSYKSTKKTGWVSSGYVKEYIDYQSISKIYLFTKKSAALFTKPSAQGKSVTVVANNGFYSTQKIVNSIGETWFRVYLNGNKLYLKNSGLTQSTFTSFSKTKYVSEKKTNLYQSYGNAHKKLTVIPKGTEVTSKKRNGDWLSVSYNGLTGYVYSKDFSENKQTVYSINGIYFTNKAAKVYGEPESTSISTGTISTGNGFISKEKTVNQTGTWYKIMYNDQESYLKGDDVVEKTFSSIKPTVLQANFETAVYSSYGTDFVKLGTISKGTKYTTEKKIGDWYEINFENTNGYVFSGDFSEYEEPANVPITEEKITDTTFVTNSEVSAYKKADGKGSAAFTIKKSAIVMVNARTSNDMYKVTDGSRTGYVSVDSLKQVRTGDPLGNRNSYQFIDLRTQSKVTADQIDRYISSYVTPKNKMSVLTGKGKVFIETGKAYGVNPLYLAAHAIHESGYGTSDISLGKNNLFGFGSYDAAPFIASYRFSSVDACIEYIAKQLKATYLNPADWRYQKSAYLGFSTKDMNNTRIPANSEGMNFYYASDPEWGKKIAAHMERIYPYNQAEYKNAVINTASPVEPNKPNGTDLFPVNIQSIANKDLTLYNSKAGTTTTTVLKPGKSFTLLEKTNDYWVRIKYDDKEYRTNTIKFDKYKNFISVKNLGRVSGTEGYLNLNVRKEASASSEKLAELTPNSYVQLVLKKDGTLMMNDKKTWYQIQLDDGTYGWVSKNYIVQELK